MNPWLGIAMVLSVLIGLVGALAFWRRLAEPHVEVTRKLLHIGMGLVALTFPWLFTEFWPIVVLAVIGTGAVPCYAQKSFAAGQSIYSAAQCGPGQASFAFPPASRRFTRCTCVETNTA